MLCNSTGNLSHNSTQLSLTSLYLDRKSLHTCTKQLPEATYAFSNVDIDIYYGGVCDCICATDGQRIVGDSSTSGTLPNDNLGMLAPLPIL